MRLHRREPEPLTTMPQAVLRGARRRRRSNGAFETAGRVVGASAGLTIKGGYQALSRLRRAARRM